MWEVLLAPSYQSQPESLLDENLYKELSLFKNETTRWSTSRFLLEFDGFVPSIFCSSMPQLLFI